MSLSAIKRWGKANIFLLRRILSSFNIYDFNIHISGICKVHVNRKSLFASIKIKLSNSLTLFQVLYMLYTVSMLKLQQKKFLFDINIVCVCAE